MDPVWNVFVQPVLSNEMNQTTISKVDNLHVYISLYKMYITLGFVKFYVADIRKKSSDSVYFRTLTNGKTV